MKIYELPVKTHPETIEKFGEFADRGVREGTAVRDHHDSDHAQTQPNVVVAALINRADDVAPGSW